MYEREKKRSLVLKTAFIGTSMSLVAALLLIVGGCQTAVENPLPERIRGVEFGLPKSEVIAVIGPSEKTFEGPVPKRDKRVRLTWVPEFHPNFDSVAFDFTEKNRLCAIRLGIKAGRLAHLQEIKDGLVSRFHVSRETPAKLKTTTDNVLLYMGEDGSENILLDITNDASGRKVLEVYQRVISATDFNQASKEWAASRPRSEPAPEDQVGWGESKKLEGKPAAPLSPGPASNQGTEPRDSK